MSEDDFYIKPKALNMSRKRKDEDDLAGLEKVTVKQPQAEKPNYDLENNHDQDSKIDQKDLNLGVTKFSTPEKLAKISASRGAFDANVDPHVGTHSTTQSIENDDSKELTVESAGPKKRSQKILMARSVRDSTFIDYKPSVCKDYREFGYCSFGDSCIFVHDRGDYKAGWELDLDWERSQKTRNSDSYDDLGPKVSPTEGEEESTTCSICGKDLKPSSESIFENTLVSAVKCGHVFHQLCAIEYSKKSKRCKKCRLQIDGAFRPTKK